LRFLLRFVYQIWVKSSHPSHYQIELIAGMGVDGMGTGMGEGKR
jgi:hypothetical protein